LTERPSVDIGFAMKYLPVGSSGAAYSKSRAFTLIELLVVIAIISVFLGLLIASLKHFREELGKIKDSSSETASSTLNNQIISDLMGAATQYDASAEFELYGIDSDGGKTFIPEPDWSSISSNAAVTLNIPNLGLHTIVSSDGKGFFRLKIGADYEGEVGPATFDHLGPSPADPAAREYLLSVPRPGGGTLQDNVYVRSNSQGELEEVYRVEYKSSLSDEAWTTYPLTSDTIAFDPPQP
jgi:prepilin-type N-terminal cleavage/methylation domain-containing protein